MWVEILDNGVILLELLIVYFVYDIVIGCDIIIELNVVFGLGVIIESGVMICVFLYLEGCYVSCGGIIGFYVWLCFGVELVEDVCIGNFVEVKNV